MRTPVRTSVTVALLVALSPVLLAFGLVASTHLAPVRAFAIERLLGALNHGVFGGAVTVEGSAGGLLTTIRFEGVRVHAPDGTRPIEAEILDVDVHWARLLGGQLAAERVDVEDGQLTLLPHAGDTLNIVAAFTSSTSSAAPEADPTPLFAPVVLEDVRIRRVWALVPGGAAPLYFRAERLRAGFRLDEDVDWHVTDVAARGFTPLAGAFDLRAAYVGGRDDVVGAVDARADLDDGSWAMLERGRLQGAEGPLHAVARGEVAPPRVRTLTGGALSSTVSAEAVVARPLFGHSVVGAARARRAGGGRVRLGAVLGAPMVVTARGEVPAALVPGLEGVSVLADVDAIAAGQGEGAASAEGWLRALIHLSGDDARALGARPRATVRAAAADGEIVAWADARSGHGEVRAALLTALAPAGPREVRGRLTASVSSGLDGLAPGLRVGVVTATASVRGALPAPAIRAVVDAESVRWRGLSAPRLRVSGEGRGLEDLSVRVRAPRARLAALGDDAPLSVEARATRRGARVQAEGRLALEDVAQADLRAEGRWSRLVEVARPRDLLRAIRGEARVEVSALRALSSVVGARIEGRAQAELQVGGGRARAEADAWGLSLPGVDARLDAHADADLGPDTTGLVLTASVAGRPALGLAARVARPFDALDAATLRRQTRFELDLSKVPLEIFGAGVSGAVDGAASGEPGARGTVARADLRLDALRYGSYASSVSGTVTASVGAHAEVQADLRGDLTGPFALSATVTPPRLDALGSPAAWLDGVRAASVEAGALDLGVLSRALGGPAVGGRASLRAGLEAGGARAEAWLGLDDVELPTLADAFGGEVIVTAGPRTTSVDAFFARAGARLPTAGLASVTGTVARPLRGWLEPEAALAETPLSVHLAAPALPLGLLSSPRRYDPRPMEGSVAVYGDLTGTLRAPELEVTLEGRRLMLAETFIEGVQAELTWTPEEIVSSGRVQQAAGRLSWSFAQRDALPRLDVEAERFDVGFASAFLPDEGAAIGGFGGEIDADLTLRGDLGAPRGEGYLRVRDGQTVVIGPLPPVSGTDARLDLDGSKVRLRAKGRTGGGSFALEADGRVVPLDDLALSGALEVEDVQIIAGGQAVTVEALTADLSVESDGDHIEARAHLSDGEVEVPGAQANALHPIESLDKIRVVGPDGRVVGAAPAETSTVAAGVASWILHVDTREPISVHGSQINGAATVDVGVRGAERGPVVSGRVQLSEGEVDLFGRQWRVMRGALLFAERQPISPELDVALEHAFPAATVRVLLSGTTTDPELELTSDPPLYDDAQLMSLLLTGSVGGGRAGGEGAALEAEAGSAAVGLVIGAVQDKLRRRLPIDALSVEVGADAQVDRVAVGRWITSRLFVAYGFRPAAEEEDNANEVRLRWRVGLGWVLEGTYGDANNGAADLLWLKRW